MVSPFEHLLENTITENSGEHSQMFTREEVEYYFTKNNHDTINESESEDGSEDEPTFIVTEGWEATDMLNLIESEGSFDAAIDFLVEGVFSGMPKHIIANMVKGPKQHRAGENSNYKVHDIKNKSHFHKTVSEALKNKKHVVVSHNGKVVFSAHPTDNPKHHVLDSGEKMAKTNVLNAMHNTVNLTGEHKGHSVKVHVIERDKKIPEIIDKRNNSRRLGSFESPHGHKTFAGIATRAAEKQKPATHHHIKAKNHHNMGSKALEQGNFHKAAEHFKNAADAATKAARANNSNVSSIKVNLANRYGKAKDNGEIERARWLRSRITDVS